MWDSKQNTLEQIAVPNTEYDTDFFFKEKERKQKFELTGIKIKKVLVLDYVVSTELNASLEKKKTMIKIIYR